MGQIVRRKKGRPSKADLAARAALESNNGHHHHRRREDEEEEERDIRRSLRRRGCVRYNLLDYDDEDYLDDDDEFEFDDDKMDDEEDDGGRREKKLKFVLKLPNNRANRGRPIRSNGASDSVVRARRADLRGSESEGEEEEDEDEEENRFVKKRKISWDGDEEDEVDDDFGDNDDEEERGEKRESYKVDDYVHGIRYDVPSRTPMPEKKLLELILDKLQKKDTYGVYAEPVDPEELPDYHDIIKQPMDFATVRKKLANGSYSIFEQFEGDVYLICSNAMQYNTPDTVYHKQAHAIKELAQKKFQRVRRHHTEQTRIEIEHTEKEANSEEKTKSNPIIKKQMKKPIGLSTQDPVSSDFSSGPTLATSDAYNTSNGVQASNDERPSSNEGLVQGVSSLVEDNVEKVEDLLLGKGTPPKLGRKPLVVDENRRGTYDISNQPVDRSESIFSTFESEDKQLIPVGLHGEHSYAQSLSRFAGTLGPIAWRTASKRIEQALPPESKFGRGWVVEYEPIPAPVLFTAGPSQKEYSSAKKTQRPAISVKTDKHVETLVSASEQLGVGRPSLNEKPCFSPCLGGSRPATPSGAFVQQQNPFFRKLQNAAVPLKGDKPFETPSANGWGEKRPVSDAKPPQVSSLCRSRSTTPTGASIQQQHPFVRKLQNASVSGKTDESPESIVTTNGCLDSGSMSEGKSSMLPNSRGSRPSTPTGSVIQPRNPFFRNNFRPENTVTNRVEANTPTPTNQKTNILQQKHFTGSAEMPASWQVDTIARNRNFLQSVPIRPPSPAGEGVNLGRFSSGNLNASVDINRMASSPSSGVSTQVIGTKASFPPRQEQGLSDPVQAMRFSAENAQKQQNKMNNMFGSLPVRPCIQSFRGDNMSGVTTSANAWMHAGAADISTPATVNPSAHSNRFPADPFYSKTRELYPQMLQPGEYPVSGNRHERSQVPFQELVSNPGRARSNETPQVQNRPMAFPQLLATDPSGIPMQSPWQGLSRHTEQKKKRDTLPPDLNVAFQSTVDPQQPDLALQL